MTKTKVAIIHDWLEEPGGAEKVLEQVDLDIGYLTHPCHSGLGNYTRRFRHNHNLQH